MPEIAINAGDSEAFEHLNNPEFLTGLRLQMLKFATQQLSDVVAAEDAVQEALIGALKNAASFQGQSALKSWVFAILKHKIADALRTRQRYVDASHILKENEESLDFSDLFNERGYWPKHEHPQPWLTPEQVMKDEHFWRVFELCLDNLPTNQGRAFMMREFIELETDEICQTMELTVSNLNVLLYRARMRLRECLNINWFAGEGA